MKDNEKYFLLIYLLLLLFSLLLYFTISRNVEQLKNPDNYQEKPLVLKDEGFLFSNKTLLGVEPPIEEDEETKGSEGLEDIVEAVIRCESSHRHYDSNGNILVGDTHLEIQAYGIAQFQIRTFNWLKKKAGKPELCWTKKNDQIYLLEWALKNGYGYLWSCY